MENQSESQYPKQLYHQHKAVKLFIGQLLESVLQFQQEGGICLLHGGQEIFKINILATVVGREEVGSITNIFVDDGTGRIILRLFEKSPGLTNCGIGEVVLIIGRLREFNRERYIAPEIIKIISPVWLKVRALEVFHQKKNLQNVMEPAPPVENIIEDVSGPVGLHDFPYEKLLKTIRELDAGSGALVEEVLARCSLEGVDKMLESLLKKGEIFYCKPGRIKIL